MTQQYDLESLKKTFTSHAMQADADHERNCTKHLAEYGEPHPHAGEVFNICKAFLTIIDEIEKLKDRNYRRDLD